MESCAAKVATKIHSKQSADCQILAGLIREETENALTDLKRQFQSVVADHIKTNTKKLKALQNEKQNNTKEMQSAMVDIKIKRNCHSKNCQGSNLTWLRPHDMNQSSMADSDSLTTPC